MPKIGKSGFGLLEIVIASVLLGVLGIGAMRMIEGLTKSAKLNGAGAEITSVKMQIHTLLSSSRTCPVAFQDLSGNRAKFDPSVLLPENPTAEQINSYLLANTLAQLKIGSLTLVKKGEKNGNFFVSSIQLTELDSSLRGDTLVNSIAARTLVASLDLSLVLGHSAEAAGLTRQIRLPILITTNNTTGSQQNEILACSINGGITELQVLSGKEDVTDCENPTTHNPINRADNTCPYATFKDILFSKPFTSPPSVSVSINSVCSGRLASCTGGATDSVYSSAEKITETGFRLRCSGSPVSGSTCAQDGYSCPGVCSWVAVGN